MPYRQLTQCRAPLLRALRSRKPALTSPARFFATGVRLSRKAAPFPTSTPLPDSADTSPSHDEASPGVQAEDLFDRAHHRASTEEPARNQRTAAEEKLWAPIVNKRIGGDSRSDGGGHGAGGGSSARFSSSRAAGASSSSVLYSAPSSHPQGSASSSSSTSTAAASTAGVVPLRFSTMHRPFMGTSTRFRNPNLSGNVSITRHDIVSLESEFLTHAPPGKINDHLCIAMTRALRWVADRAFRERYIHRATMLTTVAMAAPAAASVAAYLRMMLAPKKRLDTAPFVHPDAANGAGFPGLGGGGPAAQTSPSSTADSAGPSAPLASMKKKPYNSYADELRGLFTQSECHAVHYQILLNMAEITTLERAVVPLLQAVQFSLFLAMFLLYPRMGFRLMAYMAEESSVVWTQMINDIDLGKIAEHHVPELALSYWGLQARFVAQEALVPAVIPPKKSMAAALANGSDEEENDMSEARNARRTTAPGHHQGPPLCQKSASMRLTLPPYRRLTTRSQSEADAAAAVAQARRAALDGDRLTLRDVVLLIRSDEMVYRDLNHRTADALDRGPHEPGVVASYFLKRLHSR